MKFKPGDVVYVSNEEYLILTSFWNEKFFRNRTFVVRDHEGRSLSFDDGTYGNDSRAFSLSIPYELRQIGIIRKIL